MRWDWKEDLSLVTEVCYIRSGCSSVGGGFGKFCCWQRWEEFLKLSTYYVL